jgi:hypothetical protein
MIMVRKATTMNTLTLKRKKMIKTPDRNTKQIRIVYFWLI